MTKIVLKWLYFVFFLPADLFCKGLIRKLHAGLKDP